MMVVVGGMCGSKGVRGSQGERVWQPEGFIVARVACVVARGAVRGIRQDTVNRVGGTHTTGMHSCYFRIFNTWHLILVKFRCKSESMMEKSLKKLILTTQLHSPT